MADIVVVPVNVKTSGSVVSLVKVGVAVVQGQVGYLNATTGKYMLAQSDGTAAQAQARGIFVTPAAIDGDAVLSRDGTIDLGATLAKGTTYVVSRTLGGIAPIGDIATGDFVTHLGVAISTSLLQQSISISGIESA